MSIENYHQLPPLPWPESLVSILRRTKGEQATRNLFGQNQTPVFRLLREMGIAKNLAKSESFVTEEELAIFKINIDNLRKIALERGALSEDEILSGDAWAQHSRKLRNGRLMISADPNEWSEEADYFELYVSNPGFQIRFALSFTDRYSLNIDFHLDSGSHIDYPASGALDIITVEEKNSVEYFLSLATTQFS